MVIDSLLARPLASRLTFLIRSPYSRAGRRIREYSLLTLLASSPARISLRVVFLDRFVAPIAGQRYEAPVEELKAEEEAYTEQVRGAIRYLEHWRRRAEGALRSGRAGQIRKRCQPSMEQNGLERRRRQRGWNRPSWGALPLVNAMVDTDTS